MIDDVSFVFLRQTHWLRFVSFSKIQPSILVAREVIEVNTSRGTHPTVFYRCDRDELTLFVKDAGEWRTASPAISLPCITLVSSAPDTSIIGSDPQ